MRSPVRADGAPGTASRAGGASTRADADTASGIAARAAIAQLANRVARLRIEEVHSGDVDGDVRLELELVVRVEVRDEVRPRSDDAVAADRVLLFLVALVPLAHRRGI